MALFTAQLDVQLSQGDVFRPDWDNDRDPALGSVIVISWGSEIDKSDTVLVADAPADGHTGTGLLAGIQGGKVWHAFYLAEVNRWANLRTIRPVAKHLFDGRLDRRLRSMTPEGRNALAGAIFSFLTRTRPPRRRYFTDSQSVVWEAWEVRLKDINQFQGRSPLRVAAALANGWLSMVSSTEARRLVPLPLAWQTLPDAGLAALTQQAALADPQDQAATAIDGIARTSP